MKKEHSTKRHNTLWYNHVHLDPKEQIDMHQQPTWELSYVVSGRGIRTIGDQQEPFLPGEVVLIVPEMKHQWLFDPNYTDRRGKIENYTIGIQAETIEKLPLIFPEMEQVCQKLEEIKQEGSICFLNETAQKISEILIRMEQEDEAEHLISLLQILVLISQSQDRQVIGRYTPPTLVEDRLKEIDVFISCNYKRDLTVDLMAAHIGMNRTSFCSFFKKMKGTTFITYLNKFRMEMACYLLKNPELSISDVCYQAGYNDIPYFTRLFKKMQGVSPTEYRKQLL